MTKQEKKIEKLAPYFGGDKWAIVNNKNAYKITQDRYRKSQWDSFALICIGGALPLGFFIGLVGIIVYSFTH
jgi:hypothetical protein